MSTNSSPAHFVSEFPPYDSFYTADISTRMRVPDRIQVSGSVHQNDVQQEPPISAKVDMNVPDRILVAGNHYFVS